MNELNVYQLPEPATPVPDGYLMDGKGRMVPARAVKPQALLEDEMVRKVVGHAIDLANQIRRFRDHVFADAEAFQDLLLAEYDLTKRGARGKGNITFTTFDGLIKFQIAIGERITFGPELKVAQEAFRACIDDWSDGAREELRVLVDQAFAADKEGNVSREAVFRLLRVGFEDTRWKGGQDAIRDSIRVIGSKAYPRFYVRDTPEAPWTSIPVDLATVGG
jgi:hypothetical protein